MGLISRVSSRTYREVKSPIKMLKRVAIGRALHASATRNDYIYYPGYLKSQQQAKEFLEHPNRNPDNYESFLIAFPQAPKWADKDPELNAIREKAKGDWGALSTEEVNTLYDGHFQYRYYKYQQPTDRWKFYVSIGFLNFGLAACMIRLYMWMEHGDVTHPDYYYDTHFMTEYIKRGLQLNAGHLRGLSTKWNYQKNEWNPPKPWYLGPFPHWQSPRESGQLGFSKWQK